MSDELVEVFRAEVGEQLEEILTLLDLPPEQWEIPRLFNLFHNVKGAAAIVGAEEIRIVAHGAEDMLGLHEGEAELDTELVELLRVGARHLDALLGGEPPSAEALFEYAERAAALGLPQIDEGGPAPARPKPASTARPEGGPEASKTGAPRAPSTLRVAAAKVDGLVGLAAEIVIQTMDGEHHAGLARQLLRQLRSLAAEVPELRPRLAGPLRELGDLGERLAAAAARSRRISDELNATVRGLRMVRLDGLQGIFGRVIRESCEATGKRGRLEFAPGATAIDRELLDQLRDPLVHLLRNAVAHGVEAPEERARAGKPELGVITLTAQAVGPWVEITIADDGRGVGVEEVEARALEQGLISEEALARLSKSERLALVFTARLSTQREANTIAGRGVGLDVVRRRVHACGGRIAIHSEPGVGTRFELRVPLTRATTRGIVVASAGQRYILPALYVDRVFRPSAAELGRLDGREIVRVDDEILDLGDLQAAFGSAPRPAEGRPLVVLSHGHRRRGLLVDEILDEREFVLQGLGWNVEALRGVAGSAVLDGGDILLVLDAPALIEGGGAGQSAPSLAPASGRRRRILVVDDSVTSRTLEKNILGNAGYEVLVAVDGADGWRVLESEAVDLVISDVEMPELDGLGLTRRIRASERHATTPVILVTSRGDAEDRLAGAEAGADAYVVKGAFDQDELLQAVARLL